MRERGNKDSKDKKKKNKFKIKGRGKAEEDEEQRQKSGIHYAGLLHEGYIFVQSENSR